MWYWSLDVYTREITLHNIEEGNAERFISLALSWGINRYLREGFVTEEEWGWADFTRIVRESIGSKPVPWYLSYRVRIGIQ